jgi:hypothetical protein
MLEGWLKTYWCVEMDIAQVMDGLIESRLSIVCIVSSSHRSGFVMPTYSMYYYCSFHIPESQTLQVWEADNGGFFVYKAVRRQATICSSSHAKIEC